MIIPLTGVPVTPVAVPRTWEEPAEAGTGQQYTRADAAIRVRAVPSSPTASTRRASSSKPRRATADGRSSLVYSVYGVRMAGDQDRGPPSNGRWSNPYWNKWGVTVEDPDGYRLVLCTRAWPNA
ncbi:hypothetical protein [Streptomyces sp. NPDC003514]